MAKSSVEKNIALFQEEEPSLESYWRSIVLFGKNTASYKFSLAESLLYFAKKDKSEISLNELAEPFSKNICRHLLKSRKQSTNKTSTFLEACANYNTDKITYDELISTTEKNGFNYVLDAFHNVNGEAIPRKFYYCEKNKIILSDDLFKLSENKLEKNLEEENEARWNLVETAWEMNIAASLLDVKYDDETKLFLVNDRFRRKDITSARAALNGYQKGKCFYCKSNITVSQDSTNDCDVDHFFPHTVQKYMPDYVNINGVWNLVLACPNCNRGENGKFAKVPATKYLELLHKRNEFLISSHHPLRETIIKQTGKTEQERAIFLRDVDRRAINYLIHRWEVK